MSAKEVREYRVISKRLVEVEERSGLLEKFYLEELQFCLFSVLT